MFDLDQFIADCRAALAADASHKLVREVVARAVSDPAISGTRPTKGAGSSAVAAGPSVSTSPGLDATTADRSSGQHTGTDAPRPTNKPATGQAGTYLTTPVHTETQMPKSPPHPYTAEGRAAADRVAAQEKSGTAAPEKGANP